MAWLCRHAARRDSGELGSATRLQREPDPQSPAEPVNDAAAVAATQEPTSSLPSETRAMEVKELRRKLYGTVDAMIDAVLPFLIENDTLHTRIADLEKQANQKEQSQ